jgi:hypothetical protein
MLKIWGPPAKPWKDALDFCLANLEKNQAQTTGCDPKTQSCPKIESPCDPTRASCNPPPCDPRTTSCGCPNNTLDDAVYKWSYPRLRDRLVHEYSNPLTGEEPLQYRDETGVKKLPSKDGEYQYDITLKTYSDPHKVVKLRVHFATYDGINYVIADMITYLGPQPTIAWRWVGTLENTGLQCIITDIPSEEPENDAEDSDESMLAGK